MMKVVSSFAFFCVSWSSEFGGKKDDQMVKDKGKVYHLKLEPRNRKFRSLDSPRNHHFLYYQQNPIIGSSYGGGGGGEEEELQDLHHREQILYGGLTHTSYPTPKKRSYFPEDATVEQNNKHVKEKASVNPKAGMRRAGGEIVEVHGGHIVRSTGRKDRHSKVCTAKGPRDRRVRLSASTAIQFYDVQDRLGFDRPSKAVDWLIKKAKAAIDKLAELPAWKPTATAVPPSDGLQQQEQTSEGSKYQMSMNQSVTALMGQDDEIYPTLNGLQQQNKQISENHQLSGSSFPSRVENIKSVLPTGQTSLSFINFQSFPQNLIPRTSGSLNQDLQLSLQSYHNPVLFQQHQYYHEQQEQAMFSGPTQLGFDGSSSAGGWSSESEHHHPPSEIGLFPKILSWNAADDVSSSSIGGGGSGGGFQFSSPPSMQLHILQPLGPKNQFFLQRGPLQSSDTPSIRAWIDPGINPDHHQINPPAVHHLPELPLSGFALGGFSGYQIQARIQGDQEERDGIQNQPSSASSASYH